MTNQRIYGKIITFGLLILIANTQFKFSLSSPSKISSKLSSTTCQKDTQIDFRFTSTFSTGCSSTNASCSISHPSGTSLQFLDAYGYNSTYTLKAYEISSSSYLPQVLVASIYLLFNDGFNQVIVEIPLTNNNNLTDRIVDLDSSQSPLSDFKSFLSLPVQAKRFQGLNFLNQRDFGHFFTVTQQVGGKTITLLTSAWIFASTSLTLPSPISSTRVQTQRTGFIQADTANKLCYGSLNSGIFQTHMRQSYPLWGLWVSIVLFWLYNLLNEPNTMEIFDKKYQDNKWTCWGFYSLRYLGHQQIFTKLSRSSSLYITFSWQACVIACLFGTIGNEFNATMIIWAAFVSFAASLPIPYILGRGFLKNIYQNNINKFQIIKKKAQLLNKTSVQILEEEVDECELKIYSYYYWYYVVCFAIGLVSWVIAIHVMSLLPRQFYDRHKYWLASLGIVFVFDNLIFDPLMTKLFGGFQFYRSRGHYYHFKLGQNYKMVNQ